MHSITVVKVEARSSQSRKALANYLVLNHEQARAWPTARGEGQNK